MKKNFNLPNVLSIIRILLVPVIIWCYWDQSIPHHIWISISLLVLSGGTDVVDGFIARHFNMITNLGKVLDPIADKLTQFSVAICLSINHPQMWWIVGFIFVKEFITMIGAIIFVNTVKTTPQAKWWGKLATVIIFGTMIAFLVDDAGVAPLWIGEVESVMVPLAIAAMAFSFFNYILVYIDGHKKTKAQTMQNESEKSSNDETL